MLTSEHKLKIITIQSNLSSLFNELGEVLVVEDDRDLDDIMQRIEQMKIEINELINDYNIKED